MNRFESELKRGKFLVGHCAKCDKITWPPNDFCSFCFGELSWRQIREPGILVEHSGKDGKQFCIVEFEGVVKVMGTVSNATALRPGQKIRLLSCDFDGSPKFTFEAE
ncbi:MAG: zinc ribbon domain-containing protein [Thermoproteota archaeon]